MLNRNKRMVLLALSFVALLVGMVLTGCSQTEAGDSDKEMIEKVLAEEFNGPDEEMMELMWNQENTEIIDGTAVNKKFDEYVQEKYGEYFTESALDTFIRTSGISYHNFAYETDYTLDFKGVTIEASENASNKYTFTAQVGYQKEDGAEEIADVEGTVLFSTEEKKIGKFQYGNDSGLSDELRK